MQPGRQLAAEVPGGALAVEAVSAATEPVLAGAQATADQIRAALGAPPADGQAGHQAAGQPEREAPR